VRVLLDTNVWLSILTTDGFCRRLWRHARRAYQFYGSDDIVSEIQEKLRAKFGFSPRHADLMTLFVSQQMELVEVRSTVKASADPDDNHILAAALDANCSLLVTGDADLLALKKFQGIDIVTPREFSESIPAK
jgi:putative PIN family toxin of toxin-antitoxin system